MEKIIELEKEFIGTGEVSGFKFTQIHSTGSSFLYKVDLGSGIVHFEIFKRKIVATCIDFEKKIFSDSIFKEIYPKGKDFGIWAWCITKMDKAIEKFNEISKD